MRKRRAKGSGHYRREQAKRRARRRVLIVSEGWTELAYSRELIDHLGLNQALVRPAGGRAPPSGGRAPVYRSALGEIFPR